MVGVLHASYLILFHHLPSGAWEPIEFPSYGSDTSGRSAQDAVERCLGVGRPARPGLLQLTVSFAEGNNGVTSCDRLVESECVRRPHQILQGDGVVGLGVDQER